LWIFVWCGALENNANRVSNELHFVRCGALKNTANLASNELHTLQCWQNLHAGATRTRVENITIIYTLIFIPPMSLFQLPANSLCFIRLPNYLCLGEATLLLPFYFTDPFDCYIFCCTAHVKTVSFRIHTCRHRIKGIALAHWPSFPHLSP
jgi:hypothetical protein